MPRPSPMIAVVGAGIAGLTAAYRLQQRGFTVAVFEAQDTPGGRMRSEVHGDFVVERGAQFIASSYRNMRALARELGIDGLIEPLSNTRNAVLREGRFASADYGPRSLLRHFSPASAARLPLVGFDLVRYRRYLDFYRPLRAAALDNEDAASYVRRKLGRETLDYVVEPAFSSTFTVLPENFSKAFLLQTLAYIMRGFRLLSFRGGNGVLTRTLAERLDVRTETPIERVETTADGIAVHPVKGRSLLADAAVIAVPGNAVSGICPGLTRSEQAFFPGVRYASSIIAFAMAGREALPPFYGAGFPRREGVGLYGMAVENAKAGVVPPGKTLFNCAFSEALAAEVMDAPDREVRAAFERELVKLPLRGLSTIQGYVFHRWPSLVPQFYPGYYRALRDFKHRQDRTDRLFFAGDYLVAPYTEAALTSGLRAARDCERRLTGAGSPVTRPSRP